MDLFGRLDYSGGVKSGRDPALEIRHEDKGIALGVDVTVDRKQQSASDATVLVEPSDVQRTTDTLPEAAR